MEEIIRIEDKAHCLLNKQCDRLKKLWGEGTYLTILHSIVVYVLALKANISCSMQDFFHEVLHGNFVGIDEKSLLTWSQIPLAMLKFKTILFHFKIHL